ncbi:MAG: trigger factor [Phycisphaerae bacterium]|nr:MAG: trigger factor [Planctomycetota bacterium]KAB2941917.1 MAG: trigger factor [Phycisphaerae bacterium]MBE7456415.1 trigger factor [Planctomycetia bacterium]MCK6466196.1 trigger factor [Phycisphaerae bacterium]MCL4719973.1 trigger factor [Phycisphaerae bacterium]
MPDDVTGSTDPRDEAATALQETEAGETPDAGAVEPSEQEAFMTRLKEAIQVSRELVGPLRYRMKIGVPREILEERMRDQLKEFQRDAVIPGFRRGRAPMILVEKRFAPEVGEQVVSQFIGASFMAATENEKLDPIGDPLVQIEVEEERIDDAGVSRRQKVEKLVDVEQALDAIKLPREGPLEYTCEVEVRPDFELPELDGIPITQPKIEVRDEDVDVELRRRLMRFGTFEPVEGGPVEADDLLYVDLKIRSGDEILESLDNFDVPARSTVVKGIALPTFGEAIVGKRQGDTASVEAVIPEDYDRPDLRGKPATVETVIREIKRLIVPPLTDEKAKEWGFDSAAEVRDRLRQTLQAEADDAAQASRRKQVEDYLLEKTPMDLPQALSIRQTDRVLARRTIELLRMGFPEVEIRRRMDEMRVRAQDQAVRDLKLAFVFDKIAKQWEIEVGEDEINGAIADIAARQNRRFDRVRDDLSRNDGIYLLAMQLRDAKIADRLLEKANLQEASG